MKFNDFQCPPCRETYFEYQRILDAYAASPHEVALVTLDFPLDPSCNGRVRVPLHPAACTAALAVRAARRINRERELVDWLFRHQSDLTEEKIWAAALGCGVRKPAGSDREALLQAIQADVAAAARLGVTATPTLYVNGVRLPPVPNELLKVAIDAELERARATVTRNVGG